MASHALRLHGRRLQLAEPTGWKDDHAPLRTPLLSDPEVYEPEGG